MRGKICVEEHFCLPGAKEAGKNAFREDYLLHVQQRLPEYELRLKAMDECGVEMQVLSMTEPGIQGIVDPVEALDQSRRINDHLAEYFVQPNPKRFAGLGVVPLQNPRAAADELERAVKQLGLKGVMINGFTNMGEDRIRYLDEGPCWEFWERAEALGAPIFIHPRVPHPSQRRSLEGFDALLGSPWGFGRETAEHAIRLILSGLFDRYPRLTIVLGHLGEGLLLAVPRMEHRLRHQAPGTHGPHEHPPTHYLRNNFYFSTSGILRSEALQGAILEIGADRILYAVDYPFESIHESATWFDNCPMEEADRLKIGRTNAAQLLFANENDRN